MNTSFFMSYGVLTYRKLATLSFVVASLVGIFLLTHHTPQAEPGTHHTVILTTDGFSPTSLTIHVGDTVTFATEAGEPFWPASDLHPTHSIYPAFDPKRPLSPGESWSFLFDRAGSWNFHDHLHPTHTGRITVLTANGKTVPLNCVGSMAEKEQCWEKDVTTILQERGIDAAFTELTVLYRDPDFSGNCHAYAHLIGKQAYFLYAKNGEITLPASVSICGYGFFHAFLETLLVEGGSLSEAKQFCTYADKQLSTVRPVGVRDACYHGWGHGITDGSDPRLFGNAQGMIDASLSLCEKIADSDFQKTRCASGVFNAIEVLAQDNAHGIEREVNDNPYALCQKQKPLYREPCYTNMIPAVLRLTKNDVSAAARYIHKNIPFPDAPTTIGGTTEEVVILGLSHEFIRLSLSHPQYVTEGLSFCRSLPFSVRLSCIAGLAGGFMKYGEPGHEYEKAFSFCEEKELSGTEKDACFGYILPRLSLWYGSDASAICAKVETLYAKRYCNYRP